DTLHGGVGSDTLVGGTDSPALAPPAGDTLDGGGGDGSDTVDYSSAAGIGAPGAPVDLNNSSTFQIIGGGVGTDLLQNVENVTGSPGNDFIQGGSGANIISGGDGNDTIGGGG